MDDLDEMRIATFGELIERLYADSCRARWAESMRPRRGRPSSARPKSGPAFGGGCKPGPGAAAEGARVEGPN